MSRNLGSTKCDYCRCDDVRLEESPRPITQQEAGRYFPEYEGMLVANAECAKCGAQYLAWCDETTRKINEWLRFNRTPDANGFFDLSFRSAFNDEPDCVDLPIWRVDQFGERCGLIENPERMSYWRADAVKHPDESYRAHVAADQAAWLARREKARVKS